MAATTFLKNIFENILKLLSLVCVSVLLHIGASVYIVSVHLDQF